MIEKFWIIGLYGTFGALIPEEIPYIKGVINWTDIDDSWEVDRNDLEMIYFSNYILN